MTDDTNGAKLTAALQAMAAGDQGPLAALCHPDVVVVQPESLPFAGAYKGFAELPRLNELLAAAWSEYHATTEFVVGEPNGDRFVAMQRLKGRARATGRAFESTAMELFTFRDGRIAEIRAYYWDTKAVADLLGISV